MKQKFSMPLKPSVSKTVSVSVPDDLRHVRIIFDGRMRLEGITTYGSKRTTKELMVCFESDTPIVRKHVHLVNLIASGRINDTAIDLCVWET